MFNDMFGFHMFHDLLVAHVFWITWNGFFKYEPRLGYLVKKNLAFTHWKELHLARITCAMFTAITEIAVDSREKSKDVPAPASRSASIGVTSLHLE